MTAQKKVRLAIAGTRGIPACYGGFETFAEELSTRLLERGYTVRVYGRRHVIKHDQPTYRGVEIVLLPAPKHKYLETPLHSALSFLHLVLRRVDVVLVCNAANSPFLWILRLFRLPVAVNVDGIERKRAKWNLLGRLWYRLGEYCSCIFANRIVSDAEVIREYYESAHRVSSEVIPYGFDNSLELLVQEKMKGRLEISAASIFVQHKLTPGEFLLYVSRLEPENNAHVMIRAYESLSQEIKAKIPLVVVGDAPYAADYIQSLKALAGAHIIFTGYCFGESYRYLQLGALCYVQATEVGGTHPALVEAMGYANCVIANDTPENREVLGDAGLYYERNNPQHLAQQLLMLLQQRSRVQEYRNRAYTRARERYSWDNVAARYDELFRSMITI